MGNIKTGNIKQTGAKNYTFNMLLTLPAIRLFRENSQIRFISMGEKRILTLLNKIKVICSSDEIPAENNIQRLYSLPHPEFV